MISIINPNTKTTKYQHSTTLLIITTDVFVEGQRHKSSSSQQAEEDKKEDVSRNLLDWCKIKMHETSAVFHRHGVNLWQIGQVCDLIPIEHDDDDVSAPLPVK